MTSTSFTLRLAACCLASSLALAAEAAAPRPKAAPPVADAARADAALRATGGGDAAAGGPKADAERCIECHGPDGQGAEHASGSEGKFPKLAGQHGDYLLKQLADFRGGRRKHDVMGLMARSVEPEDLRDIVAFFASRPRPGGDGSGNRPEARELFLRGDASRGVPACASCHGASAQGSAGAANPVPALAGQQYPYLERQLLDWRSGWRANSADGVMNQATRALTDTEIQQLASFLSGLR